MIISSNYKINLGLSVLFERADGFREIETVMYPVSDPMLCDIVEVIPSGEFMYSGSGIEVDCPWEKNLCTRAFRLMQSCYGLPEVHIHLHKRIPFGAGLGAGSANAVAVLRLCNNVFELGLSDETLRGLAAQLGSDTSLFVSGRAAVATGRGEILREISLDLSGYYLMLVKPEVGVSTGEAYSGVVPSLEGLRPSEIIERPIEQWQDLLINDFEGSIFRKLPVLQDLKESMLRAGAIYSAMSGSGSTIFGIFTAPPTIAFPHFTHIVRL
ncbi:MAG: 4-(cytidine 5'-diphospho)-2-C-methyl-D-erythritol kinase [Rikenellaceae bacterium]